MTTTSAAHARDDRGDGTPGPGPGHAATHPAGPSSSFLRAEADRLLDTAHASRLPEGGFGWLDATGAVDATRPRQLWITTRMTHCLALGTLLGRSQDADLVDHGVAALTGPFADAEAGGWFAALGPAGDDTPADAPKGAYEHAFVLLAASSAVQAGRPGARDLLARAVEVQERWFWDDDAGAVVEEWDRGFSTLDPYRGANANMHSVEAYMAAADATGDPVWLERALRIATRLVDGEARAHDWRLPEHHDQRWTVLPEYNADAPEHPFRPYGVTPGHGLEWSRLMLHLAASLGRAGRAVPGWLPQAAAALYDRARTDGWDDERGGFPYTTDWQGRPVVEQRFHWVVCEAIGAAHALHAVTGEDRYGDDYARFWDYARATFLSDAPGWLHEAEVDGRPSQRTWSGRPDVYHALQTVLLPALPLAPSFAAALATAGPGAGTDGGLPDVSS